MSWLRNFRTCAASVALLTMVFAVPAQADSAPATSANKTFKSWTYNCQTLKGKDADGKEKEVKSCRIFQVLGNGKGQRPLLAVAVTYLPGKNKPVLVLLMPLGMAIPPGVQLQFDDGEKQRIAVNTCLPDGCRAGGEINDAMLAQLKNSKELKVTFADLRLKAVTVSVPLSGFSDGLAALR